VTRQPVGSPLISAKFEIPPAPPADIVRNRLINLFATGSGATHAVITAPAGYGKTTLASQWARAGAAPGPVAWLTLDDQDNSPATFWSYLLPVLHYHCPHLDCTMRPPPNPGGVDRSTLVWVAKGLAARRTPVTLILDRTEVITDHAVVSDLDFLVRAATPGLRLVVVGRGVGQFPLNRCRLTGLVVEIGTDDLALTVDETAEIAAAHGARLTRGEIEGLHDVTEGWVSAVCLHALAARSGGGKPGLPHPAGQQAIAELLRTEILDGAPAPWRDLMLRTSILAEVHPELADRLTGRSGSQGILAELVHTNSFVRLLDDGQFRYHGYFREMLHDELTDSRPELVDRLHRRAARWYAENGRYADSLHHALQIGAWDLAASVAVDKVGVASLLTSPDAEPYRAKLIELPPRERTPAAQVLRPVLALTVADVPAALAAVDEAAATLVRLDDDAGPLALALCATRMVLCRVTGDSDTAAIVRGDWDRLWGHLSATEIVDRAALRALVLGNLGVTELWGGRFLEAMAYLGHTAAATGPGTGYMVHDAFAHLAVVQAYNGRFQQADRYARESLAVADRIGVRAGARAGAASVTLAATALMWNDLPAFREHLSRAVATVSARLDPLCATSVALLRAWAACGRMDGRRALAVLQAARDDLADWHPSPAVTDLVELSAVRAHLILGDARSARHCLESVSDSAERMLALGQILAADGDPAGARRTLATLSGQQARASTLQDTALSLGRLAFIDGDTQAAAREVRKALEYGRPERHRRPFVEAGGWVRQVLRQQPELAAEHDWLPSPAQNRRPDTGSDPILASLTPREVEVLDRLAEALSTEEIADALHLSVNTVKTHLKRIYRKLGISGRSAAVRRARDLRLLPAPRREA
jgi:LuxR family maltose regulon positive regulatory protein